MSLLAGLLVLIVAVTVLRWFANVDVKTARKAINWGVLGLIALVILFLAATGRIGAAIAGLVAMSAWIMRLLSMVHMGRQFHGMFRSFRFGQGSGNTAWAGQTSEVDSAFLRMSLDHTSGDMDGEVKQGAYRGRRLRSLDRSALLALLTEVQTDADSVGLLEAFLDRAHPDWREGEPASAAPPPSSAMSTEEALRILGLKEGAAEKDIKDAYRRLMGQLHPDKGGSDYLAAKVNQAKDFLLKKPS